MRLKNYQVDSFTDRVFGGNPAAVCLLERWLPDATLQAIAMENNLSETAFVVRRADGDWDLRWFAPAVEVDLCGHATLAAAHVLFAEAGATGTVRFHSKSGQLAVERDGARLAMDFPAWEAEPVAAHPALFYGLGMAPAEVRKNRDYLVLLPSAEDVRSLAPDFARLAELDCLGVIVTAPGADCDFVSRFFAPRAGISEDPVTGSAHCTLAPFWSRKLGKTDLHARQLSARGGELWCDLRGDRVRIAGHAVLYSRAEIELPNVE